MGWVATEMEVAVQPPSTFSLPIPPPFSSTSMSSLPILHPSPSSSTLFPNLFPSPSLPSPPPLPLTPPPLAVRRRPDYSPTTGWNLGEGGRMRVVEVVEEGNVDDESRNWTREELKHEKGIGGVVGRVDWYLVRTIEYPRSTGIYKVFGRVRGPILNAHVTHMKTRLAAHFKFVCSTIVIYLNEHKYMLQVSYASVVGNIMNAMMCTCPGIACTICPNWHKYMFQVFYVSVVGEYDVQELDERNGEDESRN